MDVVGGIKTQL